jgi:hypothetical protein
VKIYPELLAKKAPLRKILPTLVIEIVLPMGLYPLAWFR